MADSRSLSVVSIGDVNIDWIVSAPDVRGIVAELRLHGVNTIREQVGGSGTMLATAFRRVGVATTLLCSVGEDGSGERAISTLRKRGVRVVAHRDRTGTGRVIIIQGRRPSGIEPKAMISHRGANVGLRLNPRALKAVTGADLLVVSGYALLEAPQSRSTLRAARVAHRFGVSVFIDLVPHEVFRNPLPREYGECLELADGVCLELGTARAFLRAPDASVADIVRRLGAMFAIVVLRLTNDRQITIVDGETSRQKTGYSVARDRTGYLDALLARQLVRLLRRRAHSRLTPPASNRRQ